MPNFLPDPLPEGHVAARVLPLGDRKIFTGATDPLGHGPEDKFPTHPRGAVIALPRAVAEAQEALGRVEIQDAAPPALPSMAQDAAQDSAP